MEPQLVVARQNAAQTTMSQAPTIQFRLNMDVDRDEEDVDRDDEEDQYASEEELEHKFSAFSDYIYNQEDFVTSNFEEKVCSQFTAIDSVPGVCSCGYQEEAHSLPSKQRNHSSQTYGRVTFLNFPKTQFVQKANFIRFAIHKDLNELAENVCNVMRQWHVKDPKLILSFNGGTKRMETIPENVLLNLKSAFRYISNKMDAWIITGGVDVGLSQLIGHLSYDVPLGWDNTKSSSRLYYIGIAAWGTVFGREHLLNKRLGVRPPLGSTNSELDTHENTGLHHYIKCTGTLPRGQVQLNPNHSHFLLVDDGEVGKYNSELDFRKSFEAHISRLQAKFVDSDMTLSKVPILQILIEGGSRSIDLVKNALEAGIPVIVLKDTGRFANCLSQLIEEIGKIKASSALTSEQIICAIKDLYHSYNCRCEGRDNPKIAAKYQAVIELYLTNTNLIRVCDSSQQCLALEDIIVETIVTSSPGLSKEDKISLALYLDKFEIAKSAIQCDSIQSKQAASVTPALLKRFMLQALALNRPKFVSLFFNVGLMESDFLNFETLFSLYEPILFTNEETPLSLYEDFISRLIGFEPKECLESLNPNLATYARQRAAMAKLSDCIFEWTRYMVSNFYTKMSKGFEDGSAKLRLNESNTEVYHQFRNNCRINTVTGDKEDNSRVLRNYDLFLWAVIFNYKEMSDLFWSRCTDQLSSACLAAGIFKRLSHIARDQGELTLANELEEHADDYERKSVVMLNHAYTINKEMTYKLLFRQIKHWGGQNCMTLAHCFEQRAFLDQPACRAFLNQLFVGDLPTGIKIYEIVLGIFFFPLMRKKIFNRRFGIVEIVMTNINLFRHRKQPHNVSTVPEVEKMLGAKNSIHPQVKFCHQKSIEVRKIIEKRRLANSRTFFTCFRIFFLSTKTKFVSHLISYMLFLFQLIYFTLSLLMPLSEEHGISVCEVYIYIWCASFIVEEIHQICNESGSVVIKLILWQRSLWNRLDLLLTCLMVTAAICRFSFSKEDFYVVRNLFALLSSGFVLRSLQFYLVSRILGPYVIMVFKMINNVIVFLYLYAIFLFSYGIFTHAVIYHNAPFNIEMIKNIVYLPYWQTYGELSLDQLEGVNATCEEGDFSCRHTSGSAQLALAIFMLATNILLINLLIATFGNTFNEVETQSQQYWAHNYFSLVSEFYQASSLPRPLSLLKIVALPLQRRFKCLRRLEIRRTSESDLKLKKWFDQRTDIKLRLFENNIMRMSHNELSSMEQDARNLTELKNHFKSEIYSIRKELCRVSLLIGDVKQHLETTTKS